MTDAIHPPIGGSACVRNSSRASTCGLAAIVRPSRTGMLFSARMPFEIWSALGARIAERSNASRWWLGDWMLFGERRYGDRYRTAAEATGLDYQTLRNYTVVARRFELSRRRDTLSFQHHAEVCALSDPEQDRWLDLAAEYGWSKQELRRRIRRAMRIEEAGPVAHELRVTVDRAHEGRWRDAAARSRCSFEEWVIRSLDAAAGVLALDRATAGPPRASQSHPPRGDRRRALSGSRYTGRAA